MPRRAREHITVAAQERFADAGGYMHMVARVHLAQAEVMLGLRASGYGLRACGG